MDILFTALALACLVGCFLAVTHAAQHAERAHSHVHRAEGLALTLRAERDRLTVLERDTEALRRELRKLSGKFYASQREAENDLEAQRYFDRTAIPASVLPGNAPTTAVCENYAAAQLEGPSSKAAKCECLYCMTRRNARAAEKAAILAARAATKPVNGGE